MESVKRSVELVFSPFGIATILLALGVLLTACRRDARTGRRFLFCGAIIFFVIFFSPLSRFLIWNLERQYPPLLIPPAAPKIDRIVILAGYAESGPLIPVTSNVSEQTLASLSEGLRLYRLLPNSKLVVSGGVVQEGQRPVANAMAEFIEQLGVPREKIIVERNSHNTYENFVEVRKILGSAPFILVASACDMRRAAGVAKRLSMNPIPAPAYIWTLQRLRSNWTLTDWISNYFRENGYVSLKNLPRLQWAYHEYLGYIWYRILGRI